MYMFISYKTRVSSSYHRTASICTDTRLKKTKLYENLVESFFSPLLPPSHSILCSMHSFGISISKILIIWLMCLCTSGFVIHRHQPMRRRKKRMENRKKVILIYVLVTCAARLSRGALTYWTHTIIRLWNRIRQSLCACECV